MSRTLQFRRLGTATLANTIGANGELIINTTNKTLTVHDGLTPGGFQLLNDLVEVDIDQFARNTANTATDNISVLQGVDAEQNNTIILVNDFTQNAYDKANSAYDYANNSVDGWARDQANSKFNSSGGQISGDVVIVGNLDVTGNTVVANHMEANTVIVETTLYSGLATRQATPLPHLIAQFTSNSSSYVQVNAQNIDPLGSADFVVTADNGNDIDYWIDMGLHGSQFVEGTIAPYDGYLLVQGSTIGQPGGNLIIGTISPYPGLETNFIAGGLEQENIVMRLGSYGANIIGDLTVTGNIIGPTINAISGGVTGNISIVSTNSAINFVANSSGDGQGYSTIELIPDTNTTSDQYLIIDPTVPSHIHIRAGGQQDDSSAELFLGGENSYFKVSSGLNPSVAISSNENVWTFNTDGTLQFPDFTAQTTAFTVNPTLDYTVTNNLKIEEGVQEKYETIVNATGTVTHNCANGQIFYHTTPSSNWTANFTNLELTNKYATTLTLVINQGATGYIANTVLIDNSVTTIKWQANTAPTPNTNSIDVLSFSILKTGFNSGDVVVLGQLSTFG